MQELRHYEVTKPYRAKLNNQIAKTVYNLFMILNEKFVLLNDKSINLKSIKVN